jgi:hypothetical protein
MLMGADRFLTVDQHGGRGYAILLRYCPSLASATVSGLRWWNEVDKHMTGRVQTNCRYCDNDGSAKIHRSSIISRPFDFARWDRELHVGAERQKREGIEGDLMRGLVSGEIVKLGPVGNCVYRLCL